MMHPCKSCALRQMPIFLPFSESEVRFMTEFRDGEVHLETGQTLYHEGDDLEFFYTVFAGQGARYKFLPNGERQLVNFLFPGDLTGLQGLLEGQASTTAVAACPMVLCRFRKTRLPELFRTSPSRAYALTWVAAVEEHFLGETITTLGQRTALQRIAWALLKIHSRLSAVGLAQGHGVAVSVPAARSCRCTWSVAGPHEQDARSSAQSGTVGRRCTQDHGGPCSCRDCDGRAGSAAGSPPSLGQRNSC
jgi:CRP/FNR family transcriptional regulator, anaerobic regulatory protein